jgi:ketosteroid isomerase-like protein
VLDGEQWAQRHRDGLKNEEFEILEPRVRLHGDAAIVGAVQRQKTVARGGDASGSFRVVLVAVRDDGRWAIAHIQLSGPLVAPGETPSFVR